MGTFDLDCDPIKCFQNPKLTQNFTTMSQKPENNKKFFVKMFFGSAMEHFLSLVISSKSLFWIIYSHIGYSLDPKKESFVKLTQLNKMIHNWTGKYFCNVFLLSLGPQDINKKNTKSFGVIMQFKRSEFWF